MFRKKRIIIDFKLFNSEIEIIASCRDEKGEKITWPLDYRRLVNFIVKEYILFRQELGEQFVEKEGEFTEGKESAWEKFVKQNQPKKNNSFCNALFNLLF